MKIPRIPTFTGLEGIDKRIQEIQTSMATNISWLQYSFGSCDRVLQQEGDTSEVVPVCFVDSKTDPIDVRPWVDDAHKAYSFWDVLDPSEIDPVENVSIRRFPTLTYVTACIVMVHLGEINSNWKVAKSTARQDLLDFFHRTLRFSGTYIMNSMVERDIEDIFTGYTIKDPLILLRDDVAGFRIEGTITFKQDC